MSPTSGAVSAHLTPRRAFRRSPDRRSRRGQGSGPEPRGRDWRSGTGTGNTAGSHQQRRCEWGLGRPRPMLALQLDNLMLLDLSRNDLGTGEVLVDHLGDPHHAHPLLLPVRVTPWATDGLRDQLVDPKFLAHRRAIFVTDADHG